MKSVLVFFFSAFLALTSLSALSATVDINTADAKALDTALVGVGPKSAEAIISYRSKHGPFKSVDDLTKVKGIGEKTVEKNRAKLSVGKAGAATAKNNTAEQ